MDSNIYETINILKGEIYSDKITLMDLISDTLKLTEEATTYEDYNKILSNTKNMVVLKKQILERRKELKKATKNLNPNNAEFVKVQIERFHKLYPELFATLERSLNAHRDEVIKDLIDKSIEYKALSEKNRDNWIEKNMQRYPDEYIQLIKSSSTDAIAIHIAVEYRHMLYGVMYRIEDSVGAITSFNLTQNEKGGLDGYIIGDKAKATLNTISAGGHKIQRFHYRTLIDIFK